MESKGSFKCSKFLKLSKNFGNGAQKKIIKKWLNQMIGGKKEKKRKKEKRPFEKFCSSTFLFPLSWSCQVQEKSCREKLENSKSKTKKEPQKWQLGLEVGGLQCKTPYHVLKLSSTDWGWGEGGGKKGAVLQSKSQFVWVEKKCRVHKWAESFEWGQSY